MPNKDADLFSPMPLDRTERPADHSPALPAPDSPPFAIAHAFKVYIPEVNGGIPEVIRLCSTGLPRWCRSEILVARVRGWGRKDIVEGVQVRRTAALASVWSMPLSPSYLVQLWRAARRVDLVHYHSP